MNGESYLRIGVLLLVIIIIFYFIYKYNNTPVRANFMVMNPDLSFGVNDELVVNDTEFFNNPKYIGAHKAGQLLALKKEMEVVNKIENNELPPWAI